MAGFLCAEFCCVCNLRRSSWGEPVPVTVFVFLPLTVPFAVVNEDPEGWAAAPWMGSFVLNLPFRNHKFFVVH